MSKMVVGTRVQSKLQLALGTLKDYASIGKVMIYTIGGSVSSNDWGFSGIEIAVVRATGHDSAPIDDKHMHEILFLVSNAPPGSSSSSVPFLAERISHRLDKTRDPNVALKTLILIHRLLRGGDRYFEQNLHDAHLSGHLRIMINKRWRCSGSCSAQNKKKNNDYNNNNSRRPMPHSSSSSSSSSSSDYVDDDGGDEDPTISFLLNYAAFLEERMGWVINQAGKLEPIMFQQQVKVEFRLYEEEKSSNPMEIVFRRLHKYQSFLERVLDCCSPLTLFRISNNPLDRLTRAAMNNILKETFQVYMSFCEGLATLVDSLFDFKNPGASARVFALDLLKRASRLSYELSDFFKICKGIIGTKNLDYPTVQIITSDHVSAMKPFLISSSPPVSPSPSPSSLSTKMRDDNETTTRAKIGEEGEATKHTSSINGGSITPSSSTPFSWSLETKISKVWVVFDEVEESSRKTTVIPMISC